MSLLEKVWSISARIFHAQHTLDLILERVRHMSKAFDTLQASVNRQTTVIDSAITLLRGLAQQIRDGASDASAMTALSTEIDAKTDSLAADVVANTTP